MLCSSAHTTRARAITVQLGNWAAWADAHARVSRVEEGTRQQRDLTYPALLSDGRSIPPPCCSHHWLEGISVSKQPFQSQSPLLHAKSCLHMQRGPRRHNRALSQATPPTSRLPIRLSTLALSYSPMSKKRLEEHTPRLRGAIPLASPCPGPLC